MEVIAELALRFLHYAALLGLFGWSAFRSVGLRHLDWLPSEQGNLILLTAAIAAPLVSLALMLVSIASMMGASVSSLDWSMTEAMIFGTDMGWAFLIRMALLIAALGALVLQPRTAMALPFAAVCFGGALMTVGWSGHAAATEGGLGLLHRLNNGIHLLAAGLWFGAIGWFLYLTVTSHRQPAHAPARPLLVVMHAFAPLGVALVGSVGLTGLVNAQMIYGLGSSREVLTTSYGQLLAAKVTLVILMLALGAHNARISRRYARSGGDEALDCPAVAAALRRTLAQEMGLGIGVVGLATLLGTMSPMTIA